MTKLFSKTSISFLKELKKNNNKMWFLEHKQDYENLLLEPMKSLVTDLGHMMLSIDEDFEIRPSINKTISRIHRDTRFSHNKTPYKTAMWLTFKRPKSYWQEAPAYYFEISPNGYRFGMGFYAATPKTMKKFRELIDEKPEEFKKAISFFKKQKIFTLEGDKYKRTIDETKPKEIQEWYQRKSFYLMCSKEINETLFSEKLVDELIKGFKLSSSLYHFLLKLR